METDFLAWRAEQIREARAWDMYWRLIEVTTFDEYLAGDLPKVPHPKLVTDTSSNNLEHMQ